MIRSDLINKARQASENAYAPYSKFKVGATLLTKSGKVFTGCNIENSSYGLSNCAERTAIFKAISEGEKNFEELVVYTDTDKLFTPCGACLQVISEFSSNMKITIVSAKEVLETTIRKLLPYEFHL